MDGRKTGWLAALAMVVALTIPAAGRAWHKHADDSGAPNYDPPLYYPRTTYWVPQLHRCLARHRAKTVSVYPANGYPDIEGSYIIIKTPTSVIPRPYQIQTEVGAEPPAPGDERPPMPVHEVESPAGPSVR